MYIGAWCCTENPDGVIAAEATCPFRGGYCYGPAALRCRPHSHTRTYPIYTPYILMAGRISLHPLHNLHDVYDKFHPPLVKSAQRVLLLRQLNPTASVVARQFLDNESPRSLIFDFKPIKRRYTSIPIEQGEGEGEKKREKREKNRERRKKKWKGERDTQKGRKG